MLKVTSLTVHEPVVISGHNQFSQFEPSTSVAMGSTLFCLPGLLVQQKIHFCGLIKVLE